MMVRSQPARREIAGGGVLLDTLRHDVTRRVGQGFSRWRTPLRVPGSQNYTPSHNGPLTSVCGRWCDARQYPSISSASSHPPPTHRYAYDSPPAHAQQPPHAPAPVPPQHQHTPPRHSYPSTPALNTTPRTLRRRHYRPLIHKRRVSTDSSSTLGVHSSAFDGEFTRNMQSASAGAEQGLTRGLVWVEQASPLWQGQPGQRQGARPGGYR